MEDFDNMPAYEMMARRDAAEQEIARLIGLFLFAYSRFVTAVHLVARFDPGSPLAKNAERSGGSVRPDPLKAIEERARLRFAVRSDGRLRYTAWCKQARALRSTRNDIAHARWGMETYGRHAIAVTTPVLVEPLKQREFTAAQLQALCEECSELVGVLSGLRKAFPL